MADAQSTIGVKITGDAKGLQTELAKAERGIGGLSASATKLVGALALAGAGKAVVDFAGTALDEADRLGDATQLLELQLGDLSEELIRAAGNFSELGLSAQDVLELQGAFADAATAVGLADEQIASFADDAAATAGAIALLTDMEAPEVISLIGKAADGSEKAMKALGIQITDAEVEARALADTGKSTAESLTESELAAASYALVLEALEPRLAAVAEGTGDVEQKQAELEAKWETLTAKIGEGLDGPLNDLLGWIIEGIEGWELLAMWIEANEQAMRDFLGPASEVLGVLAEIAKFLGSPGLAGANFVTGGGFGGGSSSSGGTLKGGDVVLNVTPRDSADTERSVIEALRNYANRNGSQVD